MCAKRSTEPPSQPQSQQPPQQPKYAIKYKPAAKRDFKKLKNNKIVLRSIDATIKALEDDPRPPGVKHLGGDTYRVRDGDFRIIYDVSDQANEVWLLRIGDRKEVYDLPK